MSDCLITAAEARERLAELESMSDWTGEDRIAAEYARTVVTLKTFADSLLTTIEHKSAQIKRLQKAVTESEVIFWEATGHDLEQQLEHRGVKLERDDMEEK